MTVTTEQVEHSYKPGAAMAPEPIPFQFLSAGDIVVEHVLSVTGLRETLGAVHYTISGDGRAKLGRITATAAWSADAVWIVRRATDLIQPASIVPHEPLPAVSVERQLDRQMLIAQEQDASLEDLGTRAVTAPPGEAMGPLPPAAQRAGRLFGFDLFGKAAALALPAVAAALAPFLPGLFQGNPGGNVTSVGAFAAIQQMLIPVGTDRIETSGPDAGILIFDATLTDADVATHPLAITKTKNGRFFRRDPDALTVLQFGASRTGALIDGLPAFKAAARYSQRYAYNPASDGTVRASAPVMVPAGTYYWADEWSIDGGGFELIGVGNKRLAASRILTALGKSAIIVQRHDTTGPSGPSILPIRFGAEGMALRGLCFESLGGGDRNTTHGVNARATISITGCIVRGYAGDGLRAVAAAGSIDFQGNANTLEVLNNLFTSNGGNGSLLAGSDVNAGDVTGNDFTGNGRFGLLDASLYGNYNAGNHYNANGVKGFGGNTLGSSVVRYGPANNRFFVMPGKAALAAITQPGTDPTIWGPFPGGPGVLPGHPLWYPGIPVFEGGPCAFTSIQNGQTVTGNYAESSQAPVVLARGVVSIGNNWHQEVSVVEARPGEGLCNVRSNNGALDSVGGFTSFNAGVYSSINIAGTWRAIVSPAVPDGVVEEPTAATVRLSYGQNPARTYWHLTGPAAPYPFAMVTNRFALGAPDSPVPIVAVDAEPTGDAFPIDTYAVRRSAVAGQPRGWKRLADGSWIADANW